MVGSEATACNQDPDLYAHTHVTDVFSVQFEKRQTKNKQNMSLSSC